MDPQHPAPTNPLPSFEGIKHAADYLKTKGPGARIRITGDFKSREGIKLYFHRKGCNVTVNDEPDGCRLVTFNSVSSSGQEVRRVEKRKYRASKRDPAEPMLYELLEARNNTLEVGEQIFVKGNDDKVRKLLKRRFPDWEFARSQVNGVWTITRTR